ncbi:AraC family transcriptional regulator [uncultured Cohaesibacter sp.]|uniref:AraC family transcriptional regulator n=1 Tax=uncultured Cohaesibacter sp. TaxID=1002546 RepID=UPI0029301A20|nr:AraC family transcriptional regulator [uncultured Cohaesibacter sp.]
MTSTEIVSLERSIEILKSKVIRLTESCPVFETPVSGLLLYQHDQPSKPENAVYEPCISVILQGAKRAILGEDSYIYSRTQFLIASVHLPTVVQIVEASPEKPCVGLGLKLNIQEISQLMTDSHLPSAIGQQTSRGLMLGMTTSSLLDAFFRLVALLDEPRDIPILGDLIKREIYYRLLVGDQGERLRQIASIGSQSHFIARSIDWLQSNYTEPFSIETLSGLANMSKSTFNHHFRLMTDLSPLQFQKRLRLQEAKRLMLAERMDAASAAFVVGYESPSQFSRDYKRLFGKSPLRDVNDLLKDAKRDHE